MTMKIQKNALAQIVVKYTTKAGKLKYRMFQDFLSEHDNALFVQGQELKNAMGQLYQLNENVPPLFKSFPTRKDLKRLTIDATGLGMDCNGKVGAFFVPATNTVCFEAASGKDLLKKLAHELKHAEQSSDETMALREKLKKENGLGYHQLNYLLEAHAYLFESFVEDLAAGKAGLSWETYQKENISNAIINLYEQDFYNGYKDSYRKDYDQEAVIDEENDRDITASQIPETLNFSDEEKTQALDALKKSPRISDPICCFENAMGLYMASGDIDAKNKVVRILDTEKIVSHNVFADVRDRYPQFSPQSKVRFFHFFQTLATLSKEMKNEKDKAVLHHNLIDLARKVDDKKLLKQFAAIGITDPTAPKKLSQNGQLNKALFNAAQHGWD